MSNSVIELDDRWARQIYADAICSLEPADDMEDAAAKAGLYRDGWDRDALQALPAQDVIALYGLVKQQLPPHWRGHIFK